MATRTFTVAATSWEQLLRALSILMRRRAVPEQKKAAEARFHTDFDGRSRDRFHDRGVTTV